MKFKRKEKKKKRILFKNIRLFHGVVTPFIRI